MWNCVLFYVLELWFSDHLWNKKEIDVDYDDSEYEQLWSFLKKTKENFEHNENYENVKITVIMSYKL